MPPKRKSGRGTGLASTSTPKVPTPLREQHDESAMEVDTAEADNTVMDIDTTTEVDTPAGEAAGKEKAKLAGAVSMSQLGRWTPQSIDAEEAEAMNNLWTPDQEASLFKAIIHRKPAGVFKNWRLIAISEHLRNHGINPNIEKHTRIPFIWAKLCTFYNMDAIDQREKSFAFDDENLLPYREFNLPNEEPWISMMADRRYASEARSSEPALDLHQPQSSISNSVIDAAAKTPAKAPEKNKRKRKRGSAAIRASTIEDSEADTPVAVGSPAVVEGGRKAKNPRATTTRKRAAAKSKPESIASEAVGDSNDNDAEDDEDRGNTSDVDPEDAPTPVSTATTGRAARGSAKKTQATRGTRRSRGARRSRGRA